MYTFSGKKKRSAFGPMCRYVDDIVAMMKVLWSKEASILDAHMPPLPFREEIFKSKKKLKIGYLINDGYITPVPTVQRAMEETIGYIAKDLGFVFVLFFLMKNVICWIIKASIIARRPELFEPYDSLGEFATVNYFAYTGAAGDMVEYTDALQGEYLVDGFKTAYLGATLPNALRPLVSTLFALAGEKRKSVFVRLGRSGGITVKEERQVNYDMDQFRYRFWQLMNEENIDLIISPVSAFPNTKFLLVDLFYFCCPINASFFYILFHST
ncbi:hypothetical protein RFI_03826 [Reticulomyxa filosa]|uniref:Amidase domain-containing protein n=1 Tax=Reticulomyxa filosa TaxID=46433 RepID=X6P5B4_RETFI|nr:hypothetical protein RFI_03826 [Reticulomyxa filosa]|eukprot:ETO33284.1 hypothetical protein RFI_03826 [Reticulomyxa filosa]